MRALLMGLGCFFSICTGTARADLDVAFVLDTTGSMDGELREAKERIQRISEALVAGRPDQRVRLAVVAYRDRGDEYVTQHSELSADVEDSRAFLATLTANGGGDGPEDVLSGLWVALDALDWGPRPSTDRELFLIGDAPPHLDYDGHVSPEAVIARAREGQHVIHAIGCRSLPREGVQFFRRVAYATEGSYQHIGAVRLGAQADDGLAGAVLAALVAPSRAPFEPLALRWSSALYSEASTLDAALQSSDGGCELRVHTPVGVGLLSPPEVAVAHDGALDVRLRPGEGRGERWHAVLGACDRAAPVHVHVEVE